MVKLKPIGLSEEDRTNPYEKIIPDRVQKLIDLYKKNHVEYPWSQTDKNEQMFEFRKSLRPDTYKYRIGSIYRVRDPLDRSKEYYFYEKQASVLNQNDDVEYSNSLTYGFSVEPECILKYNERIKSKEPVKIGDNPTYFLKWNKEEVRELLESADPNEPCMNFYIGTAGRRREAYNPAVDIMAVKNKRDFLEGDFDDLVVLNKSGMMLTEESSLHLVEKAKKKLEERSVERVTQQQQTAQTQSQA